MGRLAQEHLHTPGIELATLRTCPAEFINVPLKGGRQVVCEPQTWQVSGQKDVQDRGLRETGWVRGRRTTNQHMNHCITHLSQ